MKSLLVAKALTKDGTCAMVRPHPARNQPILAATAAFALALLSVSCVRSPVPQMAPAKLESLDLVHMEPRTIKVTVVDERPVSTVDKTDTEKNVREAFQAALSRAHVEFQADSENELSLRLIYPDQGAEGMSNTSCVEIRARLAQKSEVVLTAKSRGCAQSYNQLGMSTGSDAGPAFQEAAAILITELDRLSTEIDDLEKLPEFSVDKIEIPPLPLGANRALAVVVKDAIQQDPEWATRVERELALALRGAGYRPDPASEQRLELTLSRPAKDVGKRNRETCVEYSLVLEVEAGQGKGTGTSCRGTEESKHHESFNAVLALVVAEIEKLPGR